MIEIIRHTSWIFLCVLILIYLIDSLISYINFTVMIQSDSKIGYEKCGFSGSITTKYSYEEFKNKFGSMRLDVSYLKNIYINSLQHTYVTNIHICINDEIIIPKTYRDYTKILTFLVDKILIPHNVVKEIKKYNKEYFRNLYSFYYKLYTSGYFNEHVDDIITFDALPSKCSKSIFIHYNEDTKNIFTYLVNMDIMAEIIILSYFKILKTIGNNENVDYEKEIINDIYNFTKLNNIPYKETYYIVISNALIKVIISIINSTTNLSIDTDEQLKKYFHEWKANNYTRSYWKSLLSQIEFEYDDMFGEDINFINKTDN